MLLASDLDAAVEPAGVESEAVDRRLDDVSDLYAVASRMGRP